MILFTQKGVTLVELIVFIIVGGLFIPFAFMGISTALKNTASPETGVKLRFIAETKMEDITRWDYDSVETNVPTQTSYAYVTSDSLGRFGAAAFSGYTWMWVYESIAYQESSGHGTTTILTETTSPLPTWTTGTGYLIGQYIMQNVASSGYHFYRASFKKWQAATLYDLNVNTNIYAVPTATTYSYPVRVVQSGTSKSTEPTWPTTVGVEVEDGGVRWRFVRNSSIQNWWFGISYDEWEVVDNYFGAGFYVCLSGGTSSAHSFPFPSYTPAHGTEYNDNGVRWRFVNIGATTTRVNSTNYVYWNVLSGFSGGFPVCIQAGISGASSPSSWATNHGGLTYDGLKWISVSPSSSLALPSGTTQPVWPTTAGGEVTDNEIRWIESKVYKRANVYVRPPNCSTDDCAYSVSTIITSRTGP